MGIKSKSKGQIVAGGMLRRNTPLEDYRKQYRLWVKREDLSCPPPGPPFSKTRGVYAHLKNRPEKVIGVLDTFHSQAGQGVARACQILKKKCINFFPKYKADTELREPQILSRKLGARLRPLQAGRSCILFHAARKETEALGGYMMPNALKLDESVTETAKEVPEGKKFDRVIISASSGTIAAGVILGFSQNYERKYWPEFLVHLGYSRSHDQVYKYLRQKTGIEDLEVTLIDESYNYKDKAKDGETPPWSCNEYYDLKAFRWWMHQPHRQSQSTLFWNIG